jgi:predicted Zn-dependent peptidase
MIDRTSAPTYKAPQKFELKRPESIELGNKVPLHLVKAGSLPLIKFEFIYRAGTWFEQIRGNAYFTNKMLPEGAGRRSSADISAYLDQYGAFLELHQGPDYSGLALYTLEKHAEKVLSLIYEVLSKPNFPSTELDTLKELQLQYLEVNKEKTGFLATRLFRERLFGSQHPYGKNLGEREIECQTDDQLMDFHLRNYRNNVEIIVSGSISKHTRGLIGSIFGNGDLFSSIPFNSYELESNLEPIYIEKEGKLQSSIRYGKRMVSKHHPHYVKLLVLNEVLGGYFGSRLMQNIREEKGYTYGIYSSLVNLKNDAYWVIGTDVKKEFARKTIEEIQSEIRKLQNEEMSQTELDTVKNYFKGAYLSSITTPFSIAEKFKNIHFYDLDYSFYDQLFDRIDDVSPEDISEMAAKYLDIDTMLEVIVG